MKVTVPRMSKPQAEAWISLVSTAGLLPTTLDRQLTSAAGITNFEYGIISILNLAQDQTMRMGELAAAADSPAPRLSKAVTRLEKRGLLERLAANGDGRAVAVHLTRAGRKLWLAVTPAHVALARDTLLADYSDPELQQLHTLLQPLLRRLDPAAAVGRVPSQGFP